MISKTLFSAVISLCLLAHNSFGASSSSRVLNATQIKNGSAAFTVPSSGTGTLLYKDGTGTATATTFSGNLTGNVTGNASGSAATITGSLTGDVTSTGMATSIAAGAVTDAKVASGISASKISGNITGNAANVTGTVGVGNGGTGLATLTANNIILGNGASSPSFVAPGASNNVLQSNGTTWVSASVPTATIQVASKTATYTIMTSDDLVSGATSGGAFTVTLPGASSATKPVRVCKGDTSANFLTVSRGGTDTIQISTGTINTTVLHRQGECLVFTSDKSSKWYVDQEEREERVRMNSSGVIQTQSGNWATAGSIGTGSYQVSVGSGIFSGTPTCTCSGDGSVSNAWCQAFNTTTTNVTARTFNGAGSLVNDGPQIICKGPR